ncbi:MAG: SusC/RagA family TonB-linked outer membrane protein [Bacteroidota bacterium]|nr:SusC/RagA family TonB-linked outer membrane protein [Bacteroidota bacterium]
MRKSSMFRLATLLAMLFAVSLQIFAQNQVTGTVTDPSGKGVAGATVMVKGTNSATSTNDAGQFSISAPATGTLVISAVGFGTLEVPIQNRTTVPVRLTTQESNLNEVVVIGYGTARRRDLTGAVSTVNEKNFNKGVFTAPDQLIQGKVAGVQITNNSGQPGGASTIRIRGASALTGSGNPLFVVDGVPLDNSTPRPGLGDIGLGGSNPGVNPLNFLNPNDIVSIDVLKDASATAIYGSRAAYGVVLITTKKGQTGQPKIDFGVSAGVSSVMKKVRVLTADEFRKALTYYGLGAANDKGGNVDAFDEITRQGIVQNYNAAISGGNENARFRFSLGALNQEGVVRKSGLKKYTANLSGQFRFLNSRKLGLDVNILPSQFSEEIAPISNNAGSRGSLIGNALQWNPTENLIIKRAGLPDSFNVQRGGDLINPVALQNAISDKARVTTILASISPYFKFTDWLEYRFLYSINYGTGARRTSLQPFINFNDVQDKGRALIATNENTTQQFTHTVNVNRSLSDRVSLNGVVGYEYLKFNYKGYSMSAFGLPTAPNGFGYYGLDFTNYIQYSNPANRDVSSFADPTTELQSYFARVGLNYSDRYLLTATVRRDGSTKFGRNNKYGTFPSFSAAWNISRESFFPQITALNSLKIRGGWGKTGNQEFPAGASVLRYGFANGNNGTPLANNANPDLRWQSDRQYNIGLDANLFSNRLTFTADYFNKRTTDLLFPITQPALPAVGGAILWRNLNGNIDNTGFEFALNANIVRSRDFGWDFGVNATLVKNEVSDLSFSINTGGLDGQGITGTTVQVVRNGLPLYAYVTRQFEGIDKTTGLANYTDGGDVLYYVGNSLPKKLLGLSTSVHYKGLTLTANANGAFGYKIYNNTLNNVINVGSINNGKNIAYSVYTDPIKESFANPVTASSRFLESGNYLKLANATLSYGLGKVGNTFSGVNIYLTGQNLFVITKFNGFDPEVNVNKSSNGVPSSSIEYIPYPSARVVTLGVNFSL